MKIVNSLMGLSLLLGAAGVFANSTRAADSDFDNVVYNDEITATPVGMGFGSLFFATKVMQNEKVQAAYASLERYGRIGNITVQKIQRDAKHKANRFVLSAYKQTGWTSSRLVATLTIDVWHDYEHAPQDAPTPVRYDIGAIVLIKDSSL